MTLIKLEFKACRSNDCFKMYFKWVALRNKGYGICQARLLGNFGLNGSVPWLKDTEGALCFTCKEDIENTYHFFLDCPQFKENFFLLCQA